MDKKLELKLATSSPIEDERNNKYAHKPFFIIN
jgi:hypothetical protein